jgi:carbon monoxide dehydrogenase subunit G
MYSFETEVFVNRPQQEVFDFMSDPANDVKWQSGNQGSEWISDGPIGVGSKLRSSGKFLGRKIDFGLEVTAWDPPDRYAKKAASGPFPFESTIEFETTEDGTRVAMHGSAEAGGFFKIAEGLVGRQFLKQMNSDFETLKQLLESE